MRIFRTMSPRELLSHAVDILDELDQTVKGLTDPEEWEEALSDFEYLGVGPKGYFSVTISDITDLCDALTNRCKTRKARDVETRLSSYC